MVSPIDQSGNMPQNIQGKEVRFSALQVIPQELTSVEKSAVRVKVAQEQEDLFNAIATMSKLAKEKKKKDRVNPKR